MQMKRPSVVPMTLLVKAEAKNAFLRLKQNTCEEIGVCNLSVLLQIVQMPLSRLPARSVRCLSATGTRSPPYAYLINFPYKTIVNLNVPHCLAVHIFPWLVDNDFLNQFIQERGCKLANSTVMLH